MMQPLVQPDQTVAEVLTRWPQTIRVFIRYRMACVGCAMARFESVAEVAEIYNLKLDCFLDELHQSIDSTTDKPEIDAEEHAGDSGRRR